MHVLLKKLPRKVALLLLFFLPLEKKINIERWLRGREEVYFLNRADCVVVSFGKSGRTWLRVMLSRFYQIKHGLSKHSLMGFDNLHRKASEIPIIFFTHDNYIKDYTKHTNSKVDFYDKKVVLLVRDPRDTAVSQFFQWKYRMSSWKKVLNRYPISDEYDDVFKFVMNPDAGIPKMINFMNLWANEIPKLKNLLVIRYEDLRANTEDVLKRIVQFMGTPGSEAEIQEAIRFSSVENMKKMEQNRVFRLSGSRMAPGNRKNPNSYKVRRAKVGGYRDYFDDLQVVQIERLVNETLSSEYGYTSAGKSSQAAHAG